VGVVLKGKDSGTKNFFAGTVKNHSRQFYPIFRSISRKFVAVLNFGRKAFIRGNNFVKKIIPVWIG